LRAPPHVIANQFFVVVGEWLHIGWLFKPATLPRAERDDGSQITNVLRCLQLEAHGYQVTVTELVGWEHSMKNELIIARYTNSPRKNAQTRLLEILETLNLNELQTRFA
jgi:hypothetical protein